MKLIVGLGNFGNGYDKTRHNLGFMLVEHFLKSFEPIKETVWRNEEKFKSDITQIEWHRKHREAEKIILVKPKTFMNNSGLAVKLISDFFKIKPEDIWVIHDEVDLLLGNMKIRLGGSSAGHRGVQSVIDALHADKFWRFRMGIGSQDDKLKMLGGKIREIDDYVLGKFTSQEKGKLKDLIKRGVKAIETALEDGLERAMNRFNSK